MSNPDVVLRATKGTPLTAAEYDANAWNVYIKNRRTVTPEMYGAVGNGLTDDAPAIRALLADLPTSKADHVILKPDVHYALKSIDSVGVLRWVNLSGTFQTGETVTGGTSGATGVTTEVNSIGSAGYFRIDEITGTFADGETLTGGTSGATADASGELETAVIYIPTKDITYEGKGFQSLTMRWDATFPVTTIMALAGGAGDLAQGCRFVGLYIRGQSEGEAGEVKDIVTFFDTNFTSWQDCLVREASRSGFTGFNYSTRFVKCEAQDILNAAKTAIGFGSTATMSHFSQCYVNTANIGFKIFCRYGAYYGNAADWCDIGYQFDQPWSLDFSGNGCEQCLRFISGNALAVAINGFSGEQIPAANFGTGNWAVRFPEYDTGDPCPDDPITLDGSTRGTMNGVYCKAYNAAGTWINVTKDIRVDQSVLPEYIANVEDLTASPTINRRVPTGYFAPSYNLDVFEDRLRLQSAAQVESWQRLLLNASPAATYEYEGLVIKNVWGAGRYQFESASTQIEMVGIGTVPLFVLTDVQATVVFKNIKFSKETTGRLFSFQNCRQVRFESCVFETTNGGQVFDFIDGSCKVTLDKATMDAMTGGWTSLANFGTGASAVRCIELTGYTSVPVAGTSVAGLRVENQTPSPTGDIGWVCTTAGTPGTWKSLGTVEA